MMSPKNFIQTRMSEMACVFPYIHIKYMYDNGTCTHVIELSPINEFESNDLLTAYWIPISLEFQDLFPSEDLVFVSTDSLFELDNPELEWTPSLMTKMLNLEIFSKLISKLNVSNRRTIDIEQAEATINELPKFELEYNFEINIRSLTEKISVPDTSQNRKDGLLFHYTIYGNEVSIQSAA